MRVGVMLLAVAAGCGGKPSTPAVATGSGSGAPARPAPEPGCDPDGPYRLRYWSHGEDGWWLRFKLDHGTATFAEGIERLGLPAGPIAAAIDPTACTLAFTSKNEQAGDLHIALSLDAKTNAVTGTVTRTDPYSVKNHHGTTPISGVRDLPRRDPPACVHPGVYHLTADTKTPWKLSQGHPRFGLSCKNMAESAEARVRVEALGDAIVIDQADDQGGQSFGRSEVTRTGDCTITLSLAFQDFRVDAAALTFAGDTVTGTAATSRYEFFENGEAGENLWACSARQVKLTAKRVAD